MPGFLCFGDPHRIVYDRIWTWLPSLPSCSGPRLDGTQALAVSMVCAQAALSQGSKEGSMALRSSQKPSMPLGASGMSPTCIKFQSFLPFPESELKLNLSI